MRLLSLVVAALFAPAVRAQEPKLPANLAQPTTAYAKAVADGDKVTITLRLIESAPAVETRTITVYESIIEDKNGVRVVRMVPVQKTVQVTVMKPKAWRAATVTTEEKTVSIHDTLGKAMAADKVAKLLEKETPVLVSANGPVDPFHLLTAKEGTLVLVVPPAVLNPPPAVLPPK